MLDASAALALLFDEPGADLVAQRIAAGAVMSTVNLAEVGTVLIRRELDWRATLDQLRAQVAIEPCGVDEALAAVGIYPAGAAVDLSLGDRVCLALAKRLGLPAMTAEQAWARLSLDVQVEVIRERSGS